jgi:hypothetical protein
LRKKSMTGQKDATLQILLVGPIHTYVTSSCGLAWGCFGRCENGTPLCSGQGSSTISDCIAQDGAGIFYGITGVCHQAANRISFPAGLKAIGAGGYPQSVFTFGEYGRSLPRTSTNSWNYIRRRCSEASKSAVTFDENIAPEATKKLSDGRYDERVPMISISQEDEALRLEELSQLVQRGLGRRLEASKFQELNAIQLQLREGQAELAKRLMLDEISREQYLSALDEALSLANKQSIDLLGADDFVKIFGKLLGVDNLIDRDAFLESRRP